MARNLYGCTSADFTLTAGGRLSPGAVLTLWTARTGGTRITDLLTVDGTPITEVASGADASIAYQGPDNDKSVHWADSGVGARVAIRPVDITGEPNSLSVGTVITGDPGTDYEITITGEPPNQVLNVIAPRGDEGPATIGGLLTTKGDLAAGQGSSVANRLPIGREGNVLRPDPSQTLGLAWGFDTVGNMLPPNVATCGDTQGGVTGVSKVGTWNLDRITTDAYVGAGCWEMTATSAASFSFIFNGLGTASSSTGAIPVEPGKPVTVHAAAKAGAGTARVLRISVYWFKADGSTAASTAQDGADFQTTTSWQECDATFTAPADAYLCSMRVFCVSPAIGDSIRIDCLGLWLGKGGAWRRPSIPIRVQAATAEYGDGSVTAAKLAPDAVATAMGSLTLNGATAGVDKITWASASQNIGAGSYGLIQPRSAYDLAGNPVLTGTEELGPVWVSSSMSPSIIGANHRAAGWSIAKGSWATADVGKTWTDGTRRVMLLAVDATKAYFTLRYTGTAPGCTFDGTAPSGTWTSENGAASITWSSPTSESLSSSIVQLNRDTDSGIAWATRAIRTYVARRIVQDVTSMGEWIAAQTASVGTPISNTAPATAFVYEHVYRWPADQPGVCLVDATITAARTMTVVQWSGMQMAVASGGQVAVPGLTGGDWSTWTDAPAGDLYASAARWADGQYPRAWMMRATYGGGALIVLDSSQALAAANNAGRAGTNLKMYPSVIGCADGGAFTPVTLTTGQQMWMRGARSLTVDTSNRQWHVVKDGSSTVRWWLMAGSTGAAIHPATQWAAGMRVTKTRGTATVDTLVTDAGLLVTGAGWAEGTLS